MPARLIAYLPDAPAPSLLLQEGAALTIGRAEGNGLQLSHPSVSRSHARLCSDGLGWELNDLGSKNGSFRDSLRVEAPARLAGAAWLRFGDIYVEFTPLGDEDAAREAGRAQARRTRATALTHGVGQALDLDDMLSASVHAVTELAQCDRGYLVLAGPEAPRVAAACGTRSPRDFGGSTGALQRALEQGLGTVAHDIGHLPWLSTRESVMASGISALACLPLCDGERVIGALYADSTRPGAAITALDMELLQAFCERCALWLVARGARDRTDHASA
ncbi:FHA domain-containing protein [Pseudoxanthomonas winnipegensis]|uniref:GAF domain-containing protein n=1 Tax=Pseudoxanthomonas winnipegensis TaxID=2480810 RepID=UPI002577B9EE|nr:GAF domain-containing protein [Pseudoxanthomonas winnipegensis]WJI14583.1 FHA domain-containing protein [Pseudoxanthomonas winnipegensis]